MDVAFAATQLGFVFPTPPALAQALNALVYDPTAQPITVVLAASADRAQPKLAACVTDSGQQGAAFPASMSPTLGDALLDTDGFKTSAPLDRSYLRLSSMGVAIDLELSLVTVRAKASGDCASVWVQLDAVLDSTQGDVMLPTPDGPKSIEELGGETGKPGPQVWALHAWLGGASTPFDFNSLQ
jgi:hypothetical protein